MTETLLPLSLKMRVGSGCFHREHSPNSYKLIDEALETARRRDADIQYVPHENGPELLVVLALATAGLSLASSVIDLVVAIINARAKGIRKGDTPAEPVELIVRRSDGLVDEETILRIGRGDSVDRAEIERRVNAAIERIATHDATGEGRQA